MTEKQIQLTDEATRRLDTAMEAYRESLMESLEENRFVPGEKIIEITASDVDRAVDEFRYGKRNRLEFRQLYSQMALIIGAALLFFAAFYRTILDAFGNPPQLIAFVAGMYLLFGGLMYYRLTALRSRSTKSSTDQSVHERIARLERLLEDANRDRAKHLTK